jgi:hypothetical protein
LGLSNEEAINEAKAERACNLISNLLCFFYWINNIKKDNLEMERMKLEQLKLNATSKSLIILCALFS